MFKFRNKMIKGLDVTPPTPVHLTV